MGKVLNAFGYGMPGAVTRSVDEIVISVRNASDADIAFGDRALDARWHVRIVMRKQHIAVSQKLFGSAGVEYRPRLNGRVDL